MTNKTEKNAALELDISLGGLLCNIETLRAIDAEMGRVREDVDNTNKSDLKAMGLRFRDISHKITLIDDLLRYTMQDVVKNYEECQYIKTGMLLEGENADD